MTKNEIQNIIQCYLKQQFSCTEKDLLGEETVFTKNLLKKPHIKMLTYKACTVVNISEDLYSYVKEELKGRNRDEIFEYPLVYGQTIHFVPDVQLINKSNLPDTYTYELLEGDRIKKLSYIRGFDNSLAFNEEGETTTKIVFVAKKENEVIAIAGAAVEFEKMWEVGIDVMPEYRNDGLGNAMVRYLTLEILKKGIVPFYSASVTNIGSQMVASRAGYVPCWIDTFGNVFDEYYAYDYKKFWIRV